MPNDILVVQGTPIAWANGFGDYGDSPFTSRGQLDLTDLIEGTAREGEKLDLDNAQDGGVVNRFAHRYKVTMRIEFGFAPTAGGTVDLYWAASPTETEQFDNPGGTTGSDGLYDGTAGSGELEESLEQLQYLGSLLVTNDAVIQQASFVVQLPLQFGMPVVANNTSTNFIDDGVEHSITFTPLEWEIQ